MNRILCLAVMMSESYVGYVKLKQKKQVKHVSRSSASSLESKWTPYSWPHESTSLRRLNWVIN